MAIIPEAPQIQGIDSQPAQIQGTPMESHVATYGALQRVGQEGMALFGELAARHKELEDAKYASESALQDTLDYERTFNEAKKQSNGGVMPDGRGIGEVMNEWITDRQKQRLDDAPSAMAGTHYQTHVGSFFVKQRLDAEHLESDQRLQSFDDSLDRQTNDLASEYARGGFSADKVQTHAKILLGQVDLGAQQYYYGKKDAEERKQKILDKLADSSFAAAMANKQYGQGLTFFGAGDKSPIKGIALSGASAKALRLASNDTPDNGSVVLPDFNDPNSAAAMAAGQGGGDVTSGMDPVKRGNYILRLQDARDREMREKLDRMASEVQNYRAALLEGQPANPQWEAQLIRQMGVVDKSGKAAQELTADLKLTSTLGQSVTQLSQTPRDKLGAAGDSLRANLTATREQMKTIDPYVGEKTLRDSQRMIDTQTARELAARKEDFAAHMIKGDRDLADLAVQAKSGPAGINAEAIGQFAAITTAKQLSMKELPGETVIPKDMASRMGEVLGQLPPEQRADTFVQWRGQMGNGATPVIQQLIKQKVVPEPVGWLTNAEAAPAEFARNVIGNAYNGEKILKNAESGVYSTNPTQFSKKNRDMALSKAVAPYADALRFGYAQGEQEPAVKALSHQVEVQTAKILSNSPGKSLNDAAQEAIKSMVDPVYFPDVIKTGNSTLLLPRVVNGAQMNRDIVHSFLKYSLKTENLGGFNLDDKDGSISSLVHKTGYWVMDPTSGRLRLHATDARSQDVVIYGKDKQPVEMPLDKLMSDTPPYVLEGTRGIFQNLFNFQPKGGQGGK